MFYEIEYWYPVKETSGRRYYNCVMAVTEEREQGISAFKINQNITGVRSASRSAKREKKRYYNVRGEFELSTAIVVL